MSKVEEKEAAPKKPAKGVVYTYVGRGEAPPHVTKFMGLVEFVRGEPVEVTNELVLSKIENNPCFVKGELSREEQKKLFENDRVAKAEADKQREKDSATDAAVARHQAKLAKGGN